MGEERKIFDDFPKVDCNECAHYWDSSCDGVKTPEEGSQRLCTSFLATRSVVIPAQIEALQRALKWLAAGVILIGISNVISILGMIFG